MATPCTDDDGGNILAGHAVCVSDWDSGNNRPKVKRALAANLTGANARTIFGVAAANSAGAGGLVSILVSGEVAKQSITGLSTGAGTSRLVVTDFENATTANQCNLRHIDDNPPVGERFVIGSSDENGNLTIQPRHNSDETGFPKVFNVRAYGAVPGVVKTTGAIDVLTPTTYTADDTPFTVADVGKTIIISGAGTATGGAPLVTTIAGFTSNKIVTLADASASATDIAAAPTVFGFDAAPAARSALAAMGDVDTLFHRGQAVETLLSSG
jgi:hypothetical protein